MNGGAQAPQLAENAAGFQPSRGADAGEILVALKQELFSGSLPAHIRRSPVLDRLQKYRSPQPAL